MPTPREAYTNSVERQGYSGARLRPADFGSAGETIARAGQQVGQALGNVADNVYKIQEADAQTAAQDADNERNAAYQAKLAEFQTMQGRGAVEAAKTLPGELAKIDKDVAAKHLSGNGWATKLYNEVGDRRRAEVVGTIAKHEATQRIVWYKASAQQGQDDAAGAAATNWDNPDAANENIITAGNHAVRLAMIDGNIDPAQLEEARRHGQGAAIHLMAQRAELEDGALRAQQIIQQREELMNPKDYNELMLQLAPRAEDEQADQLAPSVIVYAGEGTPPDPYFPDPGKPGAKPEADIPDHREKPLDIVGNYAVASGVGPRKRPLKPDGTYGSANHEGIDIEYPVGTPVRATMSGIATPRQQNGGKSGYGNYVDLDHGNGVETRYAHLSRWTVKPGQVIKQGDIIGYSGQSGGVAPHLHYELRQNGNPVDPRKLADTELSIGGHNLASAQAARSVAPAPGHREIDYEASLDRIKNGGYTFRMQKRLTAMLNEEVGHETTIRARQEDDIQEQAASYLNTLPSPDAFTKFDSMPLSLRTAITAHPKLELYYRNLATGNAREAQARADAAAAKTRAAEVDKLEQQLTVAMIENPMGFANHPLLSDPQYALLGSDKLNTWLLRQKSVKDGLDGGAGVDPSKIHTWVDQWAGADLRKDTARMNRLYLEATRRAQQRAKDLGKPLESVDYDAVSREVMQTVQVKNAQGGYSTVYRGDVTAAVNQRGTRGNEHVEVRYTDAQLRNMIFARLEAKYRRAPPAAEVEEALKAYKAERGL